MIQAAPSMHSESFLSFSFSVHECAHMQVPHPMLEQATFQLGDGQSFKHSSLSIRAWGKSSGQLVVATSLESSYC